MKIINKEEAISHAEENKILQTTCKGCTFSSSQDNDNENLDDYCSVGRLEKFKKSGSEIVNVECSQKDRNYKIVNGSICTMMRGSVWEKFKKEKGFKEPEFPELARTEINLRCAFFIYMPQDKNKIEDEKEKRKHDKERVHKVAKTMKSIDSGKIPAEKIVIINNTYITPYEFITYLRRELQELNVPTKWNMEYISQQETKDLEKKEAYLKCVDVASKNVKSMYYSFFKEGDIVPPDYLSDIDFAINDDLQKFLVLLPKDERTGLFIQRLIYSQFGGNKGHLDFLSKIKEESKEQKCQNMIQPLGKIVNSLE